MTDRLDALKELLAKVEDGEWSWNLRYDAGLPEGSYEAYNGSLDAAKALHEAVLADRHWVVGYSPFVNEATADIRGLDALRATDRSVTPARAWLIAIIEVLITQEEAKCS